MAWNTAYGDGGDGYMPSWDDFTDEERAEVERIEAERMKREAERWGLWADAIIGQIGESPPSKEDQP
jgi:hypothetical protein